MSGVKKKHSQLIASKCDIKLVMFQTSSRKRAKEIKEYICTYKEGRQLKTTNANGSNMLSRINTFTMKL